MAKNLKAGDKVAWNRSQGETEGVVVEKTTRTTKIKGHTAKASLENPEYVVKSAKSGKKAIHKADALKKI